MLSELTELTLLEEGDPQSFRVRAYENARQAIAAQATDLGRLSAKDLMKIPNVGKSTAQKILELLESGRVSKLEALRQKYPRSMTDLLRLQGLGPKSVLKLQAELGIESIDGLRTAIAEKRLRTLKGFGTGSEEKLGQALTRLEEQAALKRWPISVALPHAERILSELRAVPGVIHAESCGSLRRFCETAGDIDIVVVAEHPKLLMDSLVGMKLVERVLAQGETKTSVVTSRGIQVDVRVVALEQLGAALLYFTGSKSHNIKLRQRALSRGLSLNEYALTELSGGKRVAGETEQEIYQALGLSWIDPVLREDLGEIELALQGRLPSALGRVTGDFHLHTSVSGDGRSTLEEMVHAARSRGYAVLAITDHAEGTLSGASREALLEQRSRISELQQSLRGEIELLHGVELNIGASGELDYDAEFRRGFDFCIASVHSHFDLDRAAQTRRILSAMHEPSVRMIGHPSARMIGGRPPIDLDLDQLFAAAEATNTALEVNGALPRLDLSVEALRRARSRTVSLVLTSDAHHTRELSFVEFAVRNVERAGVDASRVVNIGDPARTLAWAKRPALA